ncbi:G-protein alpha subunit-domain-containing protein [Mycena vitilis]|nr:G-protein alpha subunit-domain-containing protein [Mycena vitilis]
MVILRISSFIAKITKLRRRSKHAAVDTTAIDAAINYERGLRRRLKLVVVLGAQNAGKSTFIEQVRSFGPSSKESPQDDLSPAPNEPVSSLNATWTKAKVSPTPELIIPSCQHTALPTNIPADNDVRPPRQAVTETPFVVQVTSPHSAHVYRLEAVLTCVHREIGLQRKWFKCFDEVEAIIFLADLSSYDETLPAVDGGKPVNCLRDAMSKFEATCTRYPSLPPTIILVLNKTDLFTSKLAASPFTTHFPEYRGPQTPAAVAEYCEGLFLSLLPPQLDRRAWITSAIDDARMTGVLQEIGVFISDHSFRKSNCTF